MYFFFSFLVYTYPRVIVDVSINSLDVNVFLVLETLSMLLNNNEVWIGSDVGIFNLFISQEYVKCDFRILHLY